MMFLVVRNDQRPVQSDSWKTDNSNY